MVMEGDGPEDRIVEVEAFQRRWGHPDMQWGLWKPDNIVVGLRFAWSSGKVTEAGQTTSAGGTISKKYALQPYEALQVRR